MLCLFAQARRHICLLPRVPTRAFPAANCVVMVHNVVAHCQPQSPFPLYLRSLCEHLRRAYFRSASSPRRCLLPIPALRPPTVSS